METTETYRAAVTTLNRLRTKRDRQQRALAETERELFEEAIPAAAKAGVPKRAIMREAGVVRQTVYNVLDREEKREREIAALADSLAS